MEMRQLELFVAVAEAGSIHAGARRTLTSQPTVSKALRRLERQLGAALLVRSPQGVALTEAGRALLDEARTILVRLDRLGEIVDAASRSRESLTVGLLGGAIAAAELTGEILGAFADRFPEVAVRYRELSFVEQFDALATEQVDVAIVRPPTGDSRLQVQPLFVEPRVLCCRADHPLARFDRLAADDVVDEQFVSLEGAPPEWSAFWQLDDLRSGPLHTSVHPATTPSELQLSLMSGAAIMPIALSAWRQVLGAEALHTVPLSHAAPTEVAVAFRRAATPRLAVAFAECAREVCRRRVDRVAEAVLAG